MTSAELCSLAPPPMPRPSPIRHDQPLTDSPRPALPTRQDQLTDSGSIYFVLSSHAFAVTSPIRHDWLCTISPRLGLLSALPHSTASHYSPCPCHCSRTLRSPVLSQLRCRFLSARVVATTFLAGFDRSRVH